MSSFPLRVRGVAKTVVWIPSFGVKSALLISRHTASWPQQATQAIWSELQYTSPKQMAAAAAASAAHSASAAKHGIPGTTCKNCMNCRICDCECKTCTHERRKAAGLVCHDCNKDCGMDQCDDCYEREEDEKARAEDEPPVCYDCNQEWCNGGPWCPANGPETVNPLEAAYGMVDDEDREMHEMMKEQREEEDRRFRAQMARFAAAKGK